MRVLQFPGTYEDERGVEALEWRIAPSRPPQPPSYASYEIHTCVRGIAVWGRNFDGLSPDDSHAAGAQLHLNSQGDLTDCVLRGTASIPVDVDGVRRDGVVSFSLDLRVDASVPPYSPQNLRLSTVLDGVTYEVTDDWFEDGLLRLQAALPANARLVACISCLFSDYSPYGHGLMGMSCHRDAKEQYMAVRTKWDYFKVPATEEVPEIYRCPEYQPRVPGTGYRG